MGFDEFLASRVLQTEALQKAAATISLKIQDSYKHHNKNIDKIDKSKNKVKKRLLSSSKPADDDFEDLHFKGDQPQQSTTKRLAATLSQQKLLTRQLQIQLQQQQLGYNKKIHHEKHIHIWLIPVPITATTL